MRLVTDTSSPETPVHVEISRAELLTLTGPALAALTTPGVTDTDVATINKFLTHYTQGEPAP